MLDFKALLRGIGRLLVVAVGSFCKTMLLMLGMAVILASIVFYVLSGQQLWVGILGVQQGGVNLVMVKSDLEQRVDDFLVAKLTSGLNLWTLMVLVGLPSQVIATVYLVLSLLHMHG